QPDPPKRSEATPAARSSAAKTARPTVTDAKPPGIELILRVVGVVIAVCLAAVTAFWEALLTPLHVTIFGAVVRLPIAPLIAVVLNIGIFWFGRVVTGRTGLALLPAVAWFVVIFAAGNRTSEGDILIAGNNWVGVVTILLGAVAWAVGVYVLMFRGRRETHEPSVPTLPTRHRSRAR
ncbi:MAG TPA: hypothetical protein VE132_09005, partial [Micromonosporaceae bacterium]|nr:hypothetical protein [Micromonosporaceae bacterium]